MQVRLTAPRERGEVIYAAGDLYEASPGEAEVLIIAGLARKVKEAPEAAAVAAPEQAVTPTPAKRAQPKRTKE